jgi:hypothetical protein
MHDSIADLADVLLPDAVIAVLLWVFWDVLFPSDEEDGGGGQQAGGEGGRKKRGGKKGSHRGNDEGQ